MLQGESTIFSHFVLLEEKDVSRCAYYFGQLKRTQHARFESGARRNFFRTYTIRARGPRQLTTWNVLTPTITKPGLFVQC